MTPPVALVTPPALDPDAMPVIGRGTRLQTTTAPGETALTALVTLAEIQSRRIASSTNLVALLSAEDEASAAAVVERLTTYQLLNLQVLCGHVITRVLTERRKRERETRR